MKREKLEIEKLKNLSLDFFSRSETDNKISSTIN